jgi:hypothetical protein
MGNELECHTLILSLLSHQVLEIEPGQLLVVVGGILVLFLFEGWRFADRRGCLPQ